MLKASKHEAHPETRYLRARITDSFDRVRVYARSFGDVFSPELLIAHFDLLAQSLNRLRVCIFQSNRWFDGQSGGETPGLISNPAVKLTCVIFGTMVRESMGTLPSQEGRNL